MEYCLIPLVEFLDGELPWEKKIKRMTVESGRGRRKKLSNPAGWQTRDQPNFPLNWVWYGSVLNFSSQWSRLWKVSRQIDTQDKLIQREISTLHEVLRYLVCWWLVASTLLSITDLLHCFLVCPSDSPTGKIWRALIRFTILMSLLTCLVAQSRPTLCNTLDSSPPDSFVHGIFFKQEDWSGLPFPPPGDLFNPGLQPASSVSPALQGDSLPADPSGKPILMRDPGFWLFPCALIIHLVLLSNVLFLCLCFPTGCWNIRIILWPV